MYIFKIHIALFYLITSIILHITSATVLNAGQEVNIDDTFSQNSNIFGNSNPPDYSCQPTICLGVEPNGNTFRMTGGYIGGSLYGGFTHDGSANGNKVILRGGVIDQSLFGAYVSVHNDSPYIAANNNILDITGGSVDGFIAGGWINVSFLNPPTVDVTNADYNSVTIETDSIFFDSASIYGANIWQQGTGDASAQYNYVNLGDRSISLDLSNIFGAYVYAINGSAVASHNVVKVSGGLAGLWDFYGGYAISSSLSGTADYNEIHISGGIVSGRTNFAVYGGVGDSNGPGVTGSATGNLVDISGGEVRGDIFGGGGYSNSPSAAGVAKGNFVNISGGTITGNVYGGEGYNYDASGEATATWNTVTISGAPVFGNLTGLYGGIAYGMGDDITGNTLNLNTSGVTVHELCNFERMNFFLPQGLSGGATVLTVTGTASISGSTVEVEAAGSASPLAKGDEVILIDAGTLSGSPANGQTSGLGGQGVSLLYEFDLLVEGNRLKAVVTKAALNDRAKALPEGFVAGLGLLSHGSSLIEGQGLSGAMRAGARGATLNGLGWQPFWAVSASQSRLKSGSHVDISGISVLAGLAKRFEIGQARLTAGPFLEYGRGSYDTYNSFAASPSVRGDGQARHAGGGAMARLDLAFGRDLAHFELSARAGSLRNEFGSQDLRTISGIPAAYDYSVAYYGLHAGAGYLWDLGETMSLDLFAKYFWTRQKGTETALSSGEMVRFNDTDSDRLRLGARVARDFGEKASVFAGAAWEHEFDGQARASIGGREMEPPSLRGDTCLGELGLAMRPTGGGLTVELDIQGYLGKRQGGTASLLFKYGF